jgi:predicted dehydrogenase
MISTNIKKVFFFLQIYGLRRTLYKVIGRTRYKISLIKRSRDPDIAIIGCGQFGFATIGYFISKSYGSRFLRCYDIDRSNADSFSHFYRVQNCDSLADDIFLDNRVKVVYVSSNHNSHTDYAINALHHGKTVYIEKPVSTDTDQFIRLNNVLKNGKVKVYVGYNRPFSGAVRKIRDIANSYITGPISLSCTVIGHKIASDHWYRRPEEGTRVCGNAGHWIDLFVHMLSWRGDVLSTPSFFRVTLNSGSQEERDDNFSLTMSTDKGDIFSLMLSSRSEPYEGINEQIVYQQGDVTARIFDFRAMETWVGNKRKTYKYFPKDVGHENAILQPFTESGKMRNWEEIKISTLIMLFVTQMVRDGIQLATFDTATELAKLERISTHAPNPPIS